MKGAVRNERENRVYVQTSYFTRERIVGLYGMTSDGPTYSESFRTF